MPHWPPWQQLAGRLVSPAQRSARLRIQFPGDPMMWVSHEPIYQAPYVQGRGELRRELARLPAHRASQAPPTWPR